VTGSPQPRDDLLPVQGSCLVGLKRISFTAAERRAFVLWRISLRCVRR